jgi:hypothetical protein
VVSREWKSEAGKVKHPPAGPDGRVVLDTEMSGALERGRPGRGMVVERYSYGLYGDPDAQVLVDTARRNLLVSQDAIDDHAEVFSWSIDSKDGRADRDLPKPPPASVSPGYVGHGKVFAMSRARCETHVLGHATGVTQMGNGMMRGTRVGG